MFRSSTSSCYILMLHKTIRGNDLQPNNLALKVDTVEPKCTDSLWIPESGKVLLQVRSGIHHIFAVKYRILGFGIRNTTQGIRNPTNDWNPESKSHLKNQESRTRTLESTAWNPESKAVLDSLTWREQTIFCTIFALQGLEFLNRLQVS